MLSSPVARPDAHGVGTGNPLTAGRPVPGTVACGPIVAEVVGAGPVVVLVHGVGLGPETFGALVDDLDGATAAVVHRPGYGVLSDRPPAGLIAQADALAELVRTIALGPAVLLGVSGGATLGLLTAMRHPEVLAAAVLHEPLVGSAAPGLHDLIAGRAAALAADADPGAATRFVAELVGDRTWARLPEAWRAGVVARAAVVRREVPWFAAVDPPPAALAALASAPLTLHTTLGAASGTVRRQAAGVLMDRAGAVVHELRGARHLAQVEAPRALVTVVRAAMATIARPPGQVTAT